MIPKEGPILGLGTIVHSQGLNGRPDIGPAINGEQGKKWKDSQK